MLRSANCCAPCFGRDATAHDFIAYNRKYDDEMQCSDRDCKACPSGQRFFASCVDQRCTVDDLRQSPLAACETDSDCRLRHGTSCCQPCGTGNEDLIAVGSDDRFEQVVCGAATACPDCEPTPIAERAVCLNGRCAVASP